METNGEGLHHLGFNVKGMDEIISGLAEMGSRSSNGGTTKAGDMLTSTPWTNWALFLELLENY